MTVGAGYAPAVYAGDGSAHTFSFTWPLLDATHLVVELTSGGTTTTLVRNVDYLLTWVGAGATGSVRLIYMDGATPINDPPAVGETVTISRVVPLTQETDLRRGPFFPEVVERALDKLTHIHQQKSDDIDRSLRAPHTDSPVGRDMVLPSKVDRAGRFLGFDEDGNPVAMAAGVSTITDRTYQVDAFGAVGDGVTDDTAAVQAAIAAAPAGSIVQFSGNKHYYLRSLGTITKPLIVDGGGCRVTCDITPSGVAGTPLFCFSGSFGTDVACGAVSEDALSITTSTAADAGLFEVGEYIRLSCDDVPDLWDGSGPANVAIRELNRVASVDAGTGVIGLQYPIHNAASVSPRIASVDVLIAPEVRNFGSIEEVDPGAAYSSSTQFGPSAPNIVDFFCTVGARARNVRVNGWNLLAFSTAYSIGTTFEDCHGSDPFQPESGGNSVVCKLWYSRHVRVLRCHGANCRHLVDWSQCVDSYSEGCCDVTYEAAKTITTTAYETHGTLNKRIGSFNDSAINKQGWSVGNYQYATDKDVEISDFLHFSRLGNCTAISVWGGVDNVLIANPRIDTSYNGVRINRGSSNVAIVGGYIKSGLTAVWATEAATAYPEHVTLRGVEIIGGSSAGNVSVNIDALGDVEVSDCNISGQVCIKVSDLVACERLTVEGNRLETGGGESAIIKIGLTGQIPTGRMRIANNDCHGTTSGASIVFNSTFNLDVQGNTSADQVDVIGSLTYTANEIVINGGVFRDNGGDGSDARASKTNHDVLVPSSTSGGLYLRRELVARWRFAMNNNAEAGANAGSDLEIQAFDDAGEFIDSPITAARASSGSVNLNRSQAIVGTSSLNANVSLELRAVDGKNKSIQFSTGALARWIVRSNSTAEAGANAGSDFEIVARDDAGAQIDIPVLIQRVSGGNIYLQRPVVVEGGSAQAAGQLHQLRTAAGYNRDLAFVTGTADRWRLRANSTAEGGSNAGTDLQLLAYDDAGTLIDIPLAITRASSGQVTIGRQLKTNSGRLVPLQAVTSSAGTTGMGSGNDFLVVTGTTTHTITLPACANGRRLFLKNRSTGTVTVNRLGSDTIDGGTTFNLTAGQGTILIGNGTDWCRVANA